MSELPSAQSNELNEQQWATLDRFALGFTAQAALQLQL